MASTNSSSEDMSASEEGEVELIEIDSSETGDDVTNDPLAIPSTSSGGGLSDMMSVFTVESSNSDDSYDSDASDCSYFSELSNNDDSRTQYLKAWEDDDEHNALECGYAPLTKDELYPISLLEHCGIFSLGCETNPFSRLVCIVKGDEDLETCCKYLSHSYTSTSNICGVAKGNSDFFDSSSLLMWPISPRPIGESSGLAFCIKGKKIIKSSEEGRVIIHPYLYIFVKMDTIGNVGLFRDVFAVVLEDSLYQHNGINYSHISTYPLLFRIRQTNSLSTSCLFCAYKTQKTSSYKRHMKSHMRPREIFLCHKCLSFRTKRRKFMKAHINAHYRLQEPCRKSRATQYMCSLCPYKTFKKGDITRHEWAHQQYKPFRCHYCDYSSNRKNNVKTHIFGRHRNLF